MLAVEIEAPPRHDDLSCGEPLTQRVVQSLQQSGHPELRSLKVLELNGRILLSGRVRTYFLKQLAQSVVMSLTEVTDLENQLEVQ